MSKWMKVDPATLKVGDEVRMVDAFSMFQISGKTSPSKIGICVGGIDFTEAPECRTWFVRKPKKAKPEPGLVEGHTATHWHRRFLKQLNHNEQLQAVNSGRRVKMQRLEKEAKDARRLVQEWESRYAVLAASINELPEEPTPPTRPDEPPVGTFFRVDRRPLAAYRRVDARADGKGTERLQDVDATVRLQRPAEPPVGTFSRVDRTDRLFYRFPAPSLTSYFHLTCDAGDRPWAAWMDITEPGDTIKMLELREVGK